MEKRNENDGHLPITEENKVMYWDLVVFALIGLFAGGVVRLFYKGRQPLKVVGTLVLGATGSVLGGMVSWLAWPPDPDDFHTGALLMSLLGAGLTLAVWPIAVYGRGTPVVKQNPVP
jgi:uncharacterized membrane protein YeaQ/YmgE (transglycosylase-associated protein family)